jgi:multidrug resistance protein, MATE family
VGIWLGLLIGLGTTALLLLRRFDHVLTLHTAPPAIATP